MQFFHILSENIGLKVLIIFMSLDIIFGILRAIKEKKLNSNIGIDGLIRKFGMIISVVGFIGVDLLTGFNFIAFVPEEAKNFLNITSIGIGSLFIYLFIIYEFLSILKNMIKCKLPIPKKLQQFLEKIFKEYTSELNEKEN